MAYAALAGGARPIVSALLAGAVVGLLIVPINVALTLVSAIYVASSWGRDITAIWVLWRAVSALGTLPIPLLGLMVALRYRR
jgi:hypothetical protein